MKVIASDDSQGGIGDGSNRVNGDGIGGGVYLSVVGSTKKNTIITDNAASTSINDVYGTFSYSRGD